MEEKYYINKKTHLATDKNFVLHHSVKINKRGCPNKFRGGEGRGSEKNRKNNTRLPRLLGTQHCFLGKYDELSESVAFGQKLKYFTDQNGTKGEPHKNEF